MVLQEAVKLIELDEYQKLVADVNKDTKIDAEDALQILKVAANMDVFRIYLNLAIGEEYVINKMYDNGSYLLISFGVLLIAVLDFFERRK